MHGLGPVRSVTQVEISFTDARTFWFKASLRESEGINGSIGSTLVGLNGSVALKDGVIVANESEGRSLVFKDTVVRVREDLAEAMHIDTYEANACLISGSAMGYIVKQLFFKDN